MNTSKKKRVLTFGFKSKPEILEELKKRNNVEVVVSLIGKGSLNKGEMDLPDTIDYPLDLYKKVHSYLAEFMICRLRNHQMLLKGETHYFTIDLLNIYFRYYYNILKNNNIDVVILDNVPHLAPDLMIYYMAKEMNIETRFFVTTLFGGKILGAKSIETIGDYEAKEKLNSDTFEIKREFKKPIPNMSKWADFNYRYPLGKLHILLPNILTTFKYIKYKSLLKKSIKKDVDYKKNFVYFPLHLQPEATTNPMGGIYSDQALAIEQLRRILPDDWWIYIKENPKQSDFKRSKLFFHRINTLKNVAIVPSKKSTYELMNDAQFVATITGSAGWEAISGGKNALVFGYCWYQKLPGVFSFNENFKFEDIANYKINHEELQAELNKLYNTLHTGLIRKEYKKIYKDFDENKNVIHIVDAMERLLLRD